MTAGATHTPIKTLLALPFFTFIPPFPDKRCCAMRAAYRNKRCCAMLAAYCNKRCCALLAAYCNKRRALCEQLIVTNAARCAQLI